jgi:hypothetical protein
MPTEGSGLEHDATITQIRGTTSGAAPLPAPLHLRRLLPVAQRARPVASPALARRAVAF